MILLEIQVLSQPELQLFPEAILVGIELPNTSRENVFLSEILNIKILKKRYKITNSFR